ncbi:hypothetical protein M885DRAFT_548423 [Pelagophyceae sp. CCMP2097]|nr:hypothetical protein M885DRAFT_548423 [Pelagophyceae sp. CCMP2097]|mmetsp:Transcript_20053/g.67931  ORF Transcript_20053/g.67931 Transcript_20053/m.67931 type:complete len:295 (+) Transcript_20053:131-1015(+)
MAFLLRCLWLAALAPLGYSAVPVTTNDVAKAIRDGLQAALRSQGSRLSIEVPPGAPLALRGETTEAWWKTDDERAKVECGDVALCELVVALFPLDFKIACVYADVSTARRALKKGVSATRSVSTLPRAGDTKKKAPPPAKGFGAAAVKARIWNADLNLQKRCDVVVICGGLDGPGAETVAAASATLGADTAMLLLNTRLPGLAASGARANVEAKFVDDFVVAFAMSPPPPPTKNCEGWEALVVARTYPEPWIVARPRAIGKPQELGRRETPPTPANTAELAAIPASLFDSLFNK